MYFSRAFLVLGLGATKAAALAVFAHFMVGNTLNYLAADWNADMTNAKSSGIEAFALNIAKGEAANSQISQAFSVANSVGFKLFFSFDYAERSHGTWEQAEVTALINTWKGSGAYYQYLSKPLVSTFEGPEFASQWGPIKSATGCFFVPDYSSKGARDGLLMAPGVPDGLFSWAAWPAGTIGMNTYGDASYMQFLAQAGKPTYMMPISPAFYTNLPKYNKNWLWQGDDLWFVRWVEVLFLTQIQKDFAPPVFAQIISWNDYGESHYIGPITTKATYALTNGGAPFDYVANMPHDGFRSVLPFLISLAKNGFATVGTQKVTIWYRNSAAGACDQAGTVGNTCSQYQIEYAPGALAKDKIFFSALLGAPAAVTISIGADTFAGVWAETPATGVGIYHGSADVSGRTGQVKVTVAGIATAVGAVPIGGCTKVNFNPYVYTASGGSSSASVDIRTHVCNRGYGSGSFFNICQFSCKLGYCPVTACVCTKIGPQPAMPTPLYKNGYPSDGNRNFDGLCGFALNYGYNGAECSTTKPASPFTPTTSPFFPDTTTSGVGILAQHNSMCAFSCKYGYCPRHLCIYKSTGPIVPFPVEKLTTGVLRTTLSLDEVNLCQWTARYGAVNKDTCYVPPPPPPVSTPRPSSTQPPPPPSSTVPPPVPTPTVTPIHCIDSIADRTYIPGNLACFESDGQSMDCDHCLGLNGNAAAKRSNGALCFIVMSTDGDIRDTACPGDPPPSESPDGSAGSILGGTVDAYCAVAGNQGLFGFLSFAACFGYTFGKNGGEDYTSGLVALCDIFFLGMCTCIGSGACDVGCGGC